MLVFIIVIYSILFFIFFIFFRLLNAALSRRLELGEVAKVGVKLVGSHLLHFKHVLRLLLFFCLLNAALSRRLELGRAGA